MVAGGYLMSTACGGEPIAPRQVQLHRHKQERMVPITGPVVLGKLVEHPGLAAGSPAAVEDAGAGEADAGGRMRHIMMRYGA